MINLLPRLEAGFKQVTVGGSGRSAFVTRAEDCLVHIEVSQPSDCLALQREDVVCTDILAIHVVIGYSFTSVVNGPSQTEPPEVWQKGLQHILNIYDPEQCYIHSNLKTGLGDEVRLQAGTNKVYIGFWDEKQHILSLIR